MNPGNARPLQRGIQLPPLSTVVAGLNLPGPPGSRLPPIRDYTPRFPPTLPPPPSVRSQYPHMPYFLPITPESDASYMSDSSSGFDDSMDIDRENNHYSSSPLPSPLNTRYSSSPRLSTIDSRVSSPASAADIDSAMRYQLRSAERAVFSEPEPGTCSPIGSPTFSRSSFSPSTPSSLSSSYSWDGRALPSPSLSPRLPTESSAYHPAQTYNLAGTSSLGGRSDTAPASQRPATAFPAGFLPPPPSQSARRVAQGLQMAKPSKPTLKGKGREHQLKESSRRSQRT